MIGSRKPFEVLADIANDQDLTDGAFRLLYVLVSHGDNFWVRDVSLDELAKELHKTSRSISSHVNELDRLKYISRKQRGMGLTTAYKLEILFPNWRKQEESVSARKDSSTSMKSEVWEEKPLPQKEGVSPPGPYHQTRKAEPSCEVNSEVESESNDSQTSQLPKPDPIPAEIRDLMQRAEIPRRVAEYINLITLPDLGCLVIQTFGLGLWDYSAIVLVRRYLIDIDGANPADRGFGDRIRELIFDKFYQRDDVRETLSRNIEQRQKISGCSEADREIAEREQSFFEELYTVEVPG